MDNITQKDYLTSEREQSLVEESLAFKGKSFRARHISRIKGTSVYTFHYRSKTATDVYPLVMLVGRARGGPYFRYPPSDTSRAKGDTYLAAINLGLVTPSTRKYLLMRFGGQPYIPTGEAKKLAFLNIMYRVYDTRKLRGLQPVSVQKYLEQL